MAELDSLVRVRHHWTKGSCKFELKATEEVNLLGIPAGPEMPPSTHTSVPAAVSAHSKCPQ